MKIRKGDQIKIMSGNDKGKQGKVLAVFRDEGRVVVEGLNMRKRHMRPRRQNQKGEIITLPTPFSLSRAMVVCPKCGKAARIGYSIADGRKARVCKKCGAEL